MSYSDEQKRKHIKEIQRYIYNISHHNKRVPTIMPDGIYGPQTTAAVGSFQREYDLPVTGETDDKTWSKLVEVYFDVNNDTVLLEVFPENFELFPGDEGIVVYIIQVILESLKRRFEDIPEIVINGVFDKDTQSAINSFKEIAGVESKHPGIDIETWNKLASGFNMMNHKQKKVSDGTE
ncbi:MAG: peptidoglycan-binding protein [Oscillospiraceae bacterium]|nr:peptidoglycan-binding protein [Oscillospiraceae bacterium]